MLPAGLENRRGSTFPAIKVVASQPLLYRMRRNLTCSSEMLLTRDPEGPRVTSPATPIDSALYMRYDSPKLAALLFSRIRGVCLSFISNALSPTILHLLSVCSFGVDSFGTILSDIDYALFPTSSSCEFLEFPKAHIYPPSIVVHLARHRGLPKKNKSKIQFAPPKSMAFGSSR